ncbi:MAG: hypothetical protein ACKPKO_18040, partial [Candidatus Fonsibacter sp.]
EVRGQTSTTPTATTGRGLPIYGLLEHDISDELRARVTWQHNDATHDMNRKTTAQPTNTQSGTDG